MAKKVKSGFIESIAGNVNVYAKNVFVRLRTVKPSNLRMFSKSLVALVMTSPVPMV